MATSGHFYWPPMGRSEWPLTHRPDKASIVNRSGNTPAGIGRITLSMLAHALLTVTWSKQGANIQATATSSP